MSKNVNFHGVKVNSIYETSNYDQFKIKKGNRQINYKHIAKLVKKITEKDLCVPIEVDSELGIIDGQHRFFAYKRLGKKIRFFITETSMEVLDIQNQNNVKLGWKIEDYMKSQLDMNNPHYITLNRIVNQYDVTLGEALSAFGISKGTFRDGKFKIEDVTKPEQIIADSGLVMKNWSKGVDHKLRLGIISFIKHYPNADVSHLVQRVIKYPSKTYHCTKVEEYVNMFFDLYNYNITGKNRLIKQ